jgi:hypothetical protein
VGVLEYALSLARDLAHSWPSWPPSILSVCNSSINLCVFFIDFSDSLLVIFIRDGEIAGNNSIVIFQRTVVVLSEN